MGERSALGPAGVAASWTGEGLAIEERPALGAIAVRLRGATDRRLASAALGLDLEAPAGTAREGAGRTALRLGPDEWLILCGRTEERALAAELIGVLAGHSGAAVPIGNGTVGLEVHGPKARAFLAKGTSLDLHPRVSKPGRCAVTGFGRIRVTLWQREADRFLLLVGRSFSRSFWDWARDVAQEWAR